jgi:hypothetical protein
MLDGPFDERTTAYTNAIKNNRKNIITPSHIDNIDIDKIIDIFIETSELYDPLSLPRNRIKWLENVCRLHDSKGEYIYVYICAYKCMYIYVYVHTCIQIRL